MRLTNLNARSPCPFLSPSSGARRATCDDEGACGEDGRAACDDEGACGEEAACGEETACGAGQERDGAGKLLPPPVAAATHLTAHPGPCPFHQTSDSSLQHPRSKASNPWWRTRRRAKRRSRHADAAPVTLLPPTRPRCLSGPTPPHFRLLLVHQCIFLHTQHDRLWT